jgi:hypothetical protein
MGAMLTRADGAAFASAAKDAVVKRRTAKNCETIIFNTFSSL